MDTFKVNILHEGRCLAVVFFTAESQVKAEEIAKRDITFRITAI